MPIVTANFDANAPEEDKASDYDIIISTEVLAEGVNLHRSNVILNYDTPWNSTRLMQRIGRINRIGTTTPQIYVYYVHPDLSIEEFSFVEAARVFQANAKESALPLPGHHHIQVRAAVTHYKKSLQSESVHDQIVDHKIGPAERNALELLKLLFDLPNLASADEKLMLKQARIAVKKGRFAKLQRELNKTFKSQKKPRLSPQPCSITLFPSSAATTTRPKTRTTPSRTSTPVSPPPTSNPPLFSPTCSFSA